MPTLAIPGISDIAHNFPHYQSPEFWIPASFWLAGLLVFTAIILAADQLFAPISNVPYGIVSFFGPRGSGKSFAAVTFARRWRKYNPTKAVYTNLEKLDLPGSGPVYTNCTPAQLTDARDALVLVDEAGIELSSWNFTDKTQRMVARWIAATRHYRVMLILTAHTPGTINNRIRDVMTEMIYMESWKGLKLFRGWVYESNSSYGGSTNKKLATHQIWVPMWPTTCRSYNTESLKIKADMQGVNIIGSDASLPGMVDSEVTISSTNGAQTSSNPLLATTTRPNGSRSPSHKKKPPIDAEPTETQIAYQLREQEKLETASESGDYSDSAFDLSNPDKFREWVAARQTAKIPYQPNAVKEAMRSKPKPTQSLAPIKEPADVKQPIVDPWITALQKAGE